MKINFLDLPKMELDYEYVYNFTSSEKLKNLGERVFYSCREEFHEYIAYRTLNKFIGMIVKDKKHARKIASDISKIENKLNIKNSIFYFQKQEFNKKKSMNILVIQPSRFWRYNELRIQLLTVIMKGIKKYLPNGTQNYAYKKFLNGYTHYKDHFLGWGDTFSLNCYDLSTKEYKSLVDKSLKKKKPNP